LFFFIPENTVKRLLAVTLIVVVTAAGGVFAQIKFGGGAQAGLSFSSLPKPANEFYGLGFGGGVHADLTLLKFLGIRFNVDYHSFPMDKDKFKNILAQAFTVGGAPANGSQITYEGSTVSIVGITLNGLGKIPTGSGVTPYAILGLGLHISSASDAKVQYQGIGDITTDLANLGVLEKTKSETDFGLNFGAGSEFKLGPASIYFEVKYVLIMSKGSSSGHIPIIVGVTFGG
jgi:opacity protein-like surface antigen